MFKLLWILFLVIVWFFTLVMHSMVFNALGLRGIAYLLVLFWLIYLAGLWFEQNRITDTAWAIMLGYAIGMIRLLDLIPNNQAFAQWLRHVPKFIIGGVALGFIIIFVGILPLIAKNIIEAHKAKNRVLGRDY